MTEVPKSRKPRSSKHVKQPGLLLRVLVLSLGFSILGILLFLHLHSDKMKELVLGASAFGSTSLTEFTVTEANVRFVPSSTQLCSDTFDFIGVISTNQQGLVSYRWNYPGNESSKKETIFFATSGTRVVRTVYRQGAEASVSGQVTLEILSPNRVMSLPASFTSFCTSSVSKASLTISPGKSVSCPSTFKAIGLIQVSGTGAGEVLYQWIKNTKILKEGTFTYHGPITKRIDLEWSEKNDVSGSVQLVISAPNQLKSEKVSFSQVCPEVKASLTPQPPLSPTVAQ